MFDKKLVVRLSDTTESLYLIKKNTHLAEYSVVTPEQFKFIKSANTANLCMIPEGDQVLNTYLIELLSDAQNRTFEQHIRVPDAQKIYKLKNKPQYRHES